MPKHAHNLILTVGVIFAIVLLVTGFGPGLAYRAVVTHENPVCTTWDAARGLRENQRAVARMRTIAAEVRPGESDGVTRRWITPAGDWRIPEGTDAEYVRFLAVQYLEVAYPKLEIRPGDTVIDCGGFVGDFARYALSRGAARVIVVEPSGPALAAIRSNLADALRSGRAALVPKGVWDTPGRLHLAADASNPAANSVVIQPAAQGESIDLTTVDAIVEQLALDRVDVIKMDIEGAEVRALRGAARTLARFRPRLAVATEHTDDRVKNNRDVIATVREIAPSYKASCGYCVLNGGVIVPETLYFESRAAQ